jgi:hypothetical protein
MIGAMSDVGERDKAGRRSERHERYEQPERYETYNDIGPMRAILCVEHQRSDGDSIWIPIRLVTEYTWDEIVSEARLAGSPACVCTGCLRCHIPSITIGGEDDQVDIVLLELAATGGLLGVTPVVYVNIEAANGQVRFGRLLPIHIR